MPFALAESAESRTLPSGESGAKGARTWDIAENLHRADLTALERSEHVAEWVKLAGAKPVQSEQVSGRGGRGKTGGVAAAVRELGIDRSEAMRSAKVASLTPAAKQAARDAGEAI